MNKIHFKIHVLAAGLLWGSAIAALAQTVSHTVDFPKGDAAWTVTFKNPNAGPAAPKTAEAGTTPQLRRSIAITRRGDLRRDRVTWSDGHTTEQWWIINPPMKLFEDEKTRTVCSMKASWAADQAFDESCFQWVASSTFVKTEPYNGKRCRQYQMQSSTGIETIFYTAWIDDVTQRPVAYAIGDWVGLFSFSNSPPEEALSLPEKFQAAARQVRDLYTPPRRFGQ